MSTRQNAREIAVCIATFRRPEGLRALLRGLAGQTFQANPDARLKVVVVDDDPAGSAEPVCRALMDGFPWPLTYLRSPAKGIAPARNRGVEQTRAWACPLVAFIDDDEFPPPGWLDALLTTMERYGVDAVRGPVAPRFVEAPPPWAVRGRFFDRDYPEETGDLVGVAATNNVLVAREIFDKLGGFDPYFTSAGSDDTDFFLRAVRAGYRIAHCRESTVWESLPPERVCAGYLLRRAFWTENSWVLIHTCGGLHLGKRFFLAIKCLALALVGAAMLPSALLGKVWLIRSARLIFRALGGAYAVFGFKSSVSEYGS